MDYRGFTKTFRVDVPSSYNISFLNKNRTEAERPEQWTCGMNLLNYVNYSISHFYKFSWSQMKKINLSDFDLEELNVLFDFEDFNFTQTNCYALNCTLFYISNIYRAEFHFQELLKNFKSLSKNGTVSTILFNGFVRYHKMLNEMENNLKELNFSSDKVNEQFKNVMRILKRVSSTLHFEYVQAHINKLFDFGFHSINTTIEKLHMNNHTFANVFRDSQSKLQDLFTKNFSLPKFEVDVYNKTSTYWLKFLSTYKNISNTLKSWIPNRDTFQTRMTFSMQSEQYNISNNDEEIKSTNSSISASTIFEASKNKLVDKSKKIIEWIEEFFKLVS